jgi:hypothetical protein
MALWIRPGGEKGVMILRKLDAAQRGFEVSTEDSYHIPDLKRGARVHFRFGGRSGALHARTREPIIIDTWTHLAASYDGSKLAVFVDGKPAELDLLEDKLTESFRHEQPLEIAGYRGSLDDLRLFRRPLTDEEADRLANHMPADTLVAAPAEKRSRDEQSRLREYFLTHAAPPLLREQHAEIVKLKRREEAFLRQIPTSMVMQEMDKPRDTFILKRGQYDAPGEKVTAGVPSILPPLPEGEAADRMALAKWFTDPAHPLTARIAVNRFWQMYFGTGLVKTAEDFGSQGEPPSHPELLDWLATEFQSNGWDVKAIQRLIVTSAAYRQSSAVTPALVERDPENRLIARMSRFRLPAEIVRDNALAASGLLNRDVGGPSVSPYQPPGLWEEMAFHGVYSAQTYQQSKGRDLYRRSMYTFWKRTVPPASLVTFDAPDREKCTARRPVTNTPLQALVLMNDPTYVEAARALAQRVLRDAKPDTASRAAHAFQLVALHTPSPKQMVTLRRLAQQQLDHYGADAAAAEKLLSVGESKPDSSLKPTELAAWTAVSSVLLAMDETITKE